MLVQRCTGRGHRPPRILTMAVQDRILPFMRIKEWRNPSNQPVLNVHVDHQCQANKQTEDTEGQL
eukprot:8361903-Karenia_brevis.AAC.1